MSELCSYEDVAIAKAVLAGWRLVNVPGPSPAGRYAVIRPDGDVVGYRSTRYTAAELALYYIDTEPKLTNLLPE